jgi:hypothetical protein
MFSRRVFAVGVILLGGASASALGTAAARATPVRGHAPATRVATLPNLSYDNALSAQWVPPTSTTAAGLRPGIAEGAHLSATIRFATGIQLRHAVLTITTTGPVALGSARTETLGTVRADDPASTTVALVIRAAGSGAVDARFAGTAPDGAALRYVTTLNYATGAGRVAFSANGLLEAQVGALGLERPTIGRALYERRLVTLLGAGASERFSSPAAHRASKTTKVSGTIEYTAVDNSKHPSRTITVQIFDADGTSANGTLVASTRTNAAGAYSAKVSTLRKDGKPRQLYVRALASNKNFVILPVGTDQLPQHINSPSHKATGAAMVINLIANHTDDNNTAFDVADMLVTGDQYVLRINNNKAFPKVTATFPNSQGTDFAPSTNTARILHGDEFDWDVVLHEFGHYVASNLHIDTSAGGRHGWGDNLGEKYGKSAGIQLAWSEGFATWFALTAESVLNVKALHIPKAGDSYFDDTEDANFHVPMDTNNPYPSLGEDNELSVARTLWHIRTDADLGMSDLLIIKTLVAAKVNTFSKAIAALLPAGGAALFDDSQPVDAPMEYKSNVFACLLTNQEVSPQITTPATGTVMPGAPQNYVWTPDGAGPTNRLDQFTVQFWSPTWGKLLYESPKVNATTYTPTTDAWNTITGTTDESGQYPGTIHVVVKGVGTNAPETGPYKSCAITESVGPTLTVTPYDTTDGVIASQPPSCPSYFRPQINQFSLSGEGLQPSTSYTLQFYDPNNGYPAVTGLTGLTPGTVTSDANGAITNAVITIPVMPAEAKWPLIATPTFGRPATTTVEIVWTTCATWDTNSPNFTFYWGGAGVAPDSTVNVYWNGVLVDTTTASLNGSYGSSVNMTCPAATDTVTVDASTLDGPSELIGPAGCAFSGAVARDRAPPRPSRSGYELTG